MSRLLIQRKVFVGGVNVVVQKLNLILIFMGIFFVVAVIGFFWIIWLVYDVKNEIAFGKKGHKASQDSGVFLECFGTENGKPQSVTGSGNFVKIKSNKFIHGTRHTVKRCKAINAYVYNFTSHSGTTFSLNSVQNDVIVFPDSNVPKDLVAQTIRTTKIVPGEFLHGDFFFNDMREIADDCKVNDTRSYYFLTNCDLILGMSGGAMYDKYGLDACIVVAGNYSACSDLQRTVEGSWLERDCTPFLENRFVNGTFDPKEFFDLTAGNAKVYKAVVIETSALLFLEETVGRNWRTNSET